MQIHFKIYKYVLIIIVALSPIFHCDIFNAQVELEALFELQKSVNHALLTYIEHEELRLELVKAKFMISGGLSRVSYKEVQNTSGVKDNLKILNPINAFLTIKGLSKDLADVLKPALDKSNIKELSYVMEGLVSSKKFPSNEDLRGAAVALTRLQNTYLLKTEDLSKGCLQNDLCSVDLSVDDCFEIGKQNYDEKNYEFSIPWFEEALRKLEGDKAPEMDRHVKAMSTNDTGEVTAELTESGRKSPRSQIFDYLTWAQNIKATINIGKQFLAELTGVELDAFLDEVCVGLDTGNIQAEGEVEVEGNYSNSMKKYDALCRREEKGHHSENQALKCSYSSRNNPYFSIGPIKQEQVNLDPPVWVFYNVIYDKEIETIQKIAAPLFETAKVINSATGGTQKSTTRVSKSAWLIDEDNDVVIKVNKRIKQLTNLNADAAEDLQVANYGIGGQYYPHYDFSHTEETIRYLPIDEGNRIATFMFYMSDVRLGGATAFPHLGLSIWPEKGKAAFWYNLKTDGRGDYRTQHGACPVVLGSKWVSNKWFHERGQEFIRPCEPKLNNPKSLSNS